MVKVGDLRAILTLEIYFLSYISNSDVAGVGKFYSVEVSCDLACVPMKLFCDSHTNFHLSSIIICD